LTFSGTVAQIRLQPTILQNVVNYTVIVDVPNPDLKLMPGMTANITVMIQQVQNITKLPASALKFWPPQDYLDKAMKEYPDSVKKFLARIIEFRKRMGNQSRTSSYANVANTSGQGGTGGQGGTRSQGGFGSGGGQGSANRSSRGHMGIVWVRTIDNKLMPHRVKTGLSDGSSTQVEGNIKENDEIVVGIINNQSTATTTQTQQSPFQPQMPRPGGTTGRGGR